MVYNAEWFILQGNFSEPKNLRFIIESGFKSRAGYNGARTVLSHCVQMQKLEIILVFETLEKSKSLHLISSKKKDQLKESKLMDHYDLWEAFARKETILHGSIFSTQSLSLTFLYEF